MKNIKNTKDLLPEEFTSEEEAAEFWDSHSITDYTEVLEPTELEFAIERRHYEIEVDEETFRYLRASARERHKTVKQVASEIIKEKLAVG